MKRRAPGRKLLIATLGVATLTFNEACRNSVVANFPACDDPCGTGSSSSGGSPVESSSSSGGSPVESSDGGPSADAARE